MSEFSLINTYFKNVTSKHQNTTLGIGDDCAVSHIPHDFELVSCIDTLVAGRHFPNDTSPYAIGWKSVAVNLSDLASMGAKPYAILLAISLPHDDQQWVSEFTSGLKDICRMFHVELIGGDTTKADILTISITALGLIQKGKAIQRNGAKIKDLICVSGDIGSASLALSQILNLNNPQKNLLLEVNQTLKKILDCPIPQVNLGEKLINYANSMIDISDGLAQDLGHILAASKVGAKLYLEKIPCNQALNILPFQQKYQHILNGGDDYQLCCTISQEKFNEFNQLNPNLLYPIGEIVADIGLKLYYDDKKVDFIIEGWQHF